MQKLSIISFSVLIFLIGCKESNNSKVTEKIQVIEESISVSPTPNKSVSFAGKPGQPDKNKVKLASKVITSRAVVNDNFANAKGSIRNSIGSASVHGNITLGVEAEDPEGLKAIALYLPKTNRIFNICSNNCTDSLPITITGFNPQLAGEQAGNLRIELLVIDTLDNQTVADAITINWHPLEITAISATRTNANIALNWSGSQTIEHFNIYSSTDPTLTKDNALSLNNGSQELAYAATSIQLQDMDEFKSYYILITGINNGGESGMSSPLMIPSNNIPINLPPIALPDQYQLNEDQSFTGNILDNDSDPENGEITIQSISYQPIHGIIDLQDSGEFTYTPNLNFFGADSFNYIISDEQGQEAEGLVNLTITPVNDAPIALDDVYTLTNNRDVIVSTPGVLGNDSDIDGDKLEVLTALITEPQFGQVNHNQDGSFTYIANKEFVVSDNFVYQVKDEQNSTHSATVTILTNEELPAPIAQNDFYQTNEDITLIVNSIDNSLLANDSDPNGLKLILDENLISQPLHGQLNMALDGTFTYIPDGDYFGIDQFQYQVTSTSQKSAQATVTINVLAQPDTPIAGDDNYQLNEDEILVIDTENGLLRNDSDPDGTTIAVNTLPLETPSKGNVVIQIDGSFEYTPNPNFNGIDQFTYQIINQNNLTSQAQVTLTVTASDDAPVVIDDLANTTDNAEITIDVLANDINVDGGDLTIQSASVDIGAVSIKDNKLVYLPDINFSGIATISYSVINSAGLTDSGTVTITVINTTTPNNIPIANDDSYSLNEDQLLTASSVLTNDSDADNDPLTVLTTPVNDVLHGNLSLSSDGTFNYQPSANFNGSDSFIYSINDGQGGFAQATVSIIINAINDLPIAVDDTASVAENKTLSGLNVLTNDSDPDNDLLTISTTPVLNVKDGTLTLNNDGSYVYIPTPNINGVDSFIYQVNDGQEGSSQATVNITISSTNIAPIATNDNYTLNENESLQASSVLANDSDPDNDNLTVLTTPIVDVSNGILNLLSDGTFLYTPALNFDGGDSFVYEISDPEGATAQATVLITINNLVIPPVAFNDNYTVVSLGSSLKANVLDNDFVPEGGRLKVNSTPIVGVKNGTLVLSDDGDFEYTPSAGIIGTDSFVYEIYNENDIGAGTSQATVTITIVGVTP